MSDIRILNIGENSTFLKVQNSIINLNKIKLIKEEQKCINFYYEDKTILTVCENHGELVYHNIKFCLKLYDYL